MNFLRVIASRLAGQAGGRRHPVQRYRNYREAAEALNLEGLTLFLSFDCDTDRDIDAAPPLNDFLSERGIVASYAVPGVQLEKGHAAYAAIAGRGAEFINHGWQAHAEWRQDRYHPITFYQEMSASDVVRDIESGHAVVQDVTGQQPSGFRAPHFGGFQQDDDLAIIYRTISRLGYKYATTTIPARGLANGPAFRVGDIVEIPTFGSLPAPETILDSWTYLVDRRQYKLGDRYFELFTETIEGLSRAGVPALLTWYADPSHVWEQAPFMKAMDMIAARSIPSTRGRDLAARLAPLLTDARVKRPG